MPAIDQCEPAVIRAFEKEGWVLVQRSFVVRFTPRQGVYADLRLENAAAETSLIVVEVKCFTSGSVLEEFYRAVGQYLFYRSVLSAAGNSESLYLSLPLDVYQQFFELSVVQTVINDAKIKIVVVHLEDEEIVQWLE